ARAQTPLRALQTIRHTRVAKPQTPRESNKAKEVTMNAVLMFTVIGTVSLALAVDVAVCNSNSKEDYQMKPEKRNPWHPADAKGFQNDKTYSNGPSNTPECSAGLAPTGSDDGIADSVSRLFKPPPSTHAVVLKVRATIALRGLPLPEVVFVAAEKHPKALRNLAAKAQALADQLANIGSFAVSDRDGNQFILVGVDDE